MFIQEHKVRPIEGKYAREFREHLRRVWKGELTDEELKRETARKSRMQQVRIVWK